MPSGHGQGLLLSLCFEVLVVMTLQITVFFDRCRTVWQFIINVSKGKVTRLQKTRINTSSNHEMDVAGTSEMWVTSCHIMQCHNPRDRNVHVWDGFVYTGFLCSLGLHEFPHL